MNSMRSWLLLLVVGSALILFALVMESTPRANMARLETPDTTDFSALVDTPAPDSPEHGAILEALLQHLQISNRLRVDHIRTSGNWAFVRGTEVVLLDDAEEQETDLTVAALLQLPEGSTTGWLVIDYWTLPDEQERPLAAFLDRFRERQRAERLPDALLPDDLRHRDLDTL